MSISEHDISWQVLRRIVQDWAGAAAELAEVRSLVGGCINTTLLLGLADGGKAVLKISPHRVNPELQREAEQLKLLGGLGLPTPRLWACRLATLDDPNSYLLMEFVDGVGLNAARRKCSAEQYDELQRDLAEVTLAMHANTAEEYGRAMSGSPRYRTWAEFYRAVYDPIWRDVEKLPGLPPRCRKQIARIHGRLEELVVHDDRPRLVHWDLWATNVLAKPDAQGRWRVSALLDPLCKYAHAEAEIAYMEEFKTVTPAFLKHYQGKMRLDDSYQRIRKPVYQLYPLINDVRLFGMDYIKPLLEAAERTAAVL